MSDSTAEDEPRIWWRERVKRHVVGQFSSALVGGKLHVEYVVALGMPQERIFTGYDVVDNEHFSQGAARARTKSDALRGELGLPTQYFLASNRFIEKKNLPRLLHAYAQYRHRAGNKAWGLVMLGDGGLRSALEELVMELGIQGAVCMPGFKQYDELPAYYGLAGSFVHASTTEQWGLVVNEAMASGLPVIVSKRCGCAPDLVEEGRNGFTFDPYDVDALADCMLRMADPATDRAAMGQASREIIARWSPEFFAENLQKAAEAALNAPKRRFGLLDRALLWALRWR
jgi:glycosyltransferase involved in cell wall biosynthesis